jgi:DNA repair protein RadC
MKTHSNIADMAEEDRPRERLLRVGLRQLQDAEVLALVIGSGTRGLSSLELAGLVLKELGGPAGLQSVSVERLQDIGGVGPALAMRIAGAMELARRSANGPAAAKPPGPANVAADAAPAPG